MASKKIRKTFGKTLDNYLKVSRFLLRKRFGKTLDNYLKVRDFFLEKGLKISDPDDVEFVDIHRLPQHPVKKTESYSQAYNRQTTYNE